MLTTLLPSKADCLEILETLNFWNLKGLFRIFDGNDG